MSGVTPLVDTLLATRLAQRLDLVPLKPQAEIAGPVAVTEVEKTANDVRLPSRAALERLWVDLDGSRNDKPGARSSAPAGVTLSAMARAISVILDPQMSPALKIRSSEAIWLQSRPPVVQLLTARLVQAVAYSGLFYESHLRQFAAGLRPLEDMAREPQAPLLPSLLPAASVDAALVPRPTAKLSADPAVGPFAAGPAAEAQAVHSEPIAHPTVYGRDGKPEKSLLPFREIAGQVDDIKTSAAGPASEEDSSSTVVAAIHPDALGLVRQQLELLSVPVFRWFGEAWPGTPLEWDIKEEQAEDTGLSGAEAPPTAWTTNLSMTLPRLKTVQARLTLAGNTLMVRMACDENATLAVLDEGRRALFLRFDTLGLQLTTLEVGMTDADNSLGQPELSAS